LPWAVVVVVVVRYCAAAFYFISKHSGSTPASLLLAHP
jgi:hypothetical protein